MTIDSVKIGIVTARFNDLITSRLRDAAIIALRKKGLKEINIITIDVPGSFELPLASQWLIENKKVDGVIALGAVIKGDTDHYDYVCQSAASGLMNVQLKTGKSVGFGVLTCETLEQALNRVGGKLGNKGEEVANAVVEMVELDTLLRAQK